MARTWVCELCNGKNTGQRICVICETGIPPPLAGDWQCEFCTLINSVDNESCFVCEYPRKKRHDVVSQKREVGPQVSGNKHKQRWRESSEAVKIISTPKPPAQPKPKAIGINEWIEQSFAQRPPKYIQNYPQPMDICEKPKRYNEKPKSYNQKGMRSMKWKPKFGGPSALSEATAEPFAPKNSDDLGTEALIRRLIQEEMCELCGKKRGIEWGGCGHKICRSCVKEKIKSGIVSEKWASQALTCPMKGCKIILPQNVFFRHFWTPSTRKQLEIMQQKFNMSQTEVLVQCPSKDCGFGRGEDEKKSYDNVLGSRPQRVLSSTLNDKKKVLKSRYTFKSVKRAREDLVWSSFEAKKNYIAVIDLGENICYVDDPGLFREDEIGTLHKKAMAELGLWESYEKWINNPCEHYLDLQRYAGFARQDRIWKPNSCTLNAAHSGMSEKIVLEALKGSGRKKGDEFFKEQGLHKMKPLLWNPLKVQLDKMTK